MLESLDVVTLILSVMSVGYLYFGIITRLERRLTKLEEHSQIARDGLKQITEITRQVTQLEVKMALFWQTVEKSLPAIVHSPHTPRRDLLLEKIQNGCLSHSEMEELLADLQTNLEEFPTEKRLAVVLIIGSLQNRLVGQGDLYHVNH